MRRSPDTVNHGEAMERGSPEWNAELKRMAKTKRQAFCGQAGGRKRSDGKPCGSTYVKANGLCKMHGGSARRGAEHPLFKHGRSSMVFKELPKKFHDAYMASLTDPDILSLRDDIAISDARVAELLARLDTSESSDRWLQVGAAMTFITTELAKTDPDLNEVEDSVTQIQNLVKNALADERTWRDLRTQTQHRRKLVDAERQRLKDLHAYLTAEEALTLVARLTDAIIRHVEDKAALSAILLEVKRLTGNDPAEHKRRLAAGA